MKNRHKIEERKSFTKDEKIFILDKSKGMCSHCGKKLTIGDDFTVEHVIPISKGGTNEHWNIVALCEDCNKDKSNDIINPVDYYKYLNEEYLEVLSTKQCEYYKNVNWLDKYNFTKEDRILLKVPGLIPGALKYGMQRGDIRNLKNCLMLINFIMEKAQYSDIDSIVDVYRRYTRKFNINIKSSRIKQLISETFSKGVIYILRNSSKEIIGVLPVALVKDGESSYAIKIFTPAYTRPKPDYFLALTTAIDNIIENIFDLQITNEYVPIYIDFCAADKSRTRISKSLRFKVDSMYQLSESMATVLSEMAVYTKDKVDTYDYNAIFGGFSEGLVHKYGIQTDNVMSYLYDYWRS